MTASASGVLTHVSCAVLFVADLLWRSERVRLMLRGAGSDVRRHHALALTAFGDAAALLTPWRSGGEIARAVGARAAGVSLAVASGVLAVEFLIAYVIAGGAGAWLTLSFGAELWSGAAPSSSGSGAGRTVIVTVIVLAAIAVAVVSVVAGKSVAQHLTRAMAALKSALSAARRIPRRTLAWCGALSFLALVARIAVLPLLASTIPGGPSLGAMALASFALLYAQIATPTPAGAGAVEFAFLSGAMGVSEGAGSLLGWWRVYTALLPVIAGLTLGVVVFGRGAWSSLLPATFKRARPISG